MSSIMVIVLGIALILAYPLTLRRWALSKQSNHWETFAFAQLSGGLLLILAGLVQITH